MRNSCGFCFVVRFFRGAVSFCPVPWPHLIRNDEVLTWLQAAGSLAFKSPCRIPQRVKTIKCLSECLDTSLPFTTSFLCQLFPPCFLLLKQIRKKCLHFLYDSLPYCAGICLWKNRAAKPYFPEEGNNFWVGLLVAVDKTRFAGNFKQKVLGDAYHAFQTIFS